LRGIADAIVLDHHKAEGPPPDVVATVNPNRLDCNSGLGNLCAGAIAFLTCVALVRCLRRSGHFVGRTEPNLLEMLDMVALASVCDVMPLVGLNRAFVYQGLKVLARRNRPGLAALMDAAGVKERPSAMTLGFALGPRINAGGRIGEADMGLRLLLTGEALEAGRLAQALDGVNRERQQVEAGMLDDQLGAFHAFLDDRLAAARGLPGAADLMIEGSVAVGGVTEQLAEQLSRLAPFGPGNDEPMLVLPRVRVARADRIGREGATIRAFLESEGGGGRLKSVMFRAKEGPVAEALLLRGGPPLHVAGHVRMEHWNGVSSANFIIQDAANV